MPDDSPNSMHPVNQALRFGLELGALVALGYWGWTTHTGLVRIVWALGIPLGAAVAWGAFRVPGDTAHGGGAPIPIPGVVRLGIELGLFGVASWSLVAAGRPLAGGLLALGTLVHYLTTLDRARWLLTG